MNDFTVKVWGVATDGAELISGKDAQAIITLLSSEIQAITKRNHALAAQVEVLKDSINKCTVDGVALLRLSPELKQAVAATPRQYLAEIRAEAVKDFARALSNTVQIPNGPMTRVDYYKAAIRHAIQFAEQYAAKVRQRSDQC